MASETERAGKLHASIRYIASWLNLHKNTAQSRVTGLVRADLIEKVDRGSMHSSASYRVTQKGLAALQVLRVPLTWEVITHDGGVDTEGSGTWYRSAQVPDGMRQPHLRGPWEMWSSLPHNVWYTPDDALPYLTTVTTRSVRNWTKTLATLEIPLAEWGKAGTRFRLLDADPGVFDQLRLVQEHEAAQQGRTLVSRASLERSYDVERTRADEALEKSRRGS
ncbi:UNVERIFIED_CONTAM: hypothetical protein RF653_03495 [Kocuria sp. CPCC 205316]|uniref:hypothetical protein n=1 Tax=Kocuria TaxID=57493 RepID=UPI0036DC5461